MCQARIACMSTQFAAQIVNRELRRNSDTKVPYRADVQMERTEPLTFRYTGFIHLVQEILALAWQRGVRRIVDR